MQTSSVSRCTKDLNFDPVLPWPKAFPPVSWRGFLLCGFERDEQAPVVELGNEQGLIESFLACHPRLSLAELSRLLRKWPATLAGRDGTLEGRMKGTPAENNARAKTGSMTNARAMAGYVSTADGEPVAFAIISNNFGVTPDQVDQTIDAIVVTLAEFSRTPRRGPSAAAR